MMALLALLGFTGSGGCGGTLACRVEHPRAPDVVLVLGHSLVNGNGSDSFYGGVEVPSGITYRHAGTTQTSWVAAPSIAPYLAVRMARPATIIMRGQGGATIATIGGSLWTSAQADCAALGVVPDRVVVWSGENDTGTTGARDAYPTTLETLLDSIEDTYPSAEIDVVQIAGDDSSMVYATEVRASQAAVVAAEPARRHLVDPRPGQPQLQTDRVHLVGGSGGGNDVVARLIVAGW